MNATSTVAQLVEDATQALIDAGVAFGHGTTNAHDEAVWLVLWRLRLPLDDLEGVAQRSVSPADTALVQALVTQRIQSRQPAAYLTREAWLQGVSFYIDERAIVPRSFIAELLADGSIDPWLGEHTQRVLDLCTGNGSLAVLAALAYPDVQVDASDISRQALEVAAINISRHQLDARVHLCESDGLAALPGSYDLILCNPPYVNTGSMAALPPEFQAEPALALAGGTDGMDFVRQLLADASAHLTPGGVLVLEIGHERAYFETAFPRLEAVWLAISAGEDQVLLLTREALPV